MDSERIVQCLNMGVHSKFLGEAVASHGMPTELFMGG
jgi:hypothetical protein